MANEKLSEYLNSLTAEPADDDLFDLSILISVGPDVYQSQKMRYAEIKASGVAIPNDIVPIGNAAGDGIEASTAKIGGVSGDENAMYLAQEDFFTGNNYALWQGEFGATQLNAGTGNPVVLSINNNPKLTILDGANSGVHMASSIGDTAVIGTNTGNTGTGARLHIRGIGATDSTNAFTISNSTGGTAHMLKLQDDGLLFLLNGAGVNEITIGGDYSAATDNQLPTRLDVKTFVESQSGSDFVGYMSGVISGGEITINADPAKFDLAAGTGIIVDFQVPTSPVITPVSWIEQLAIPIGDLSALFTTLRIDSSGNIQQSAGIEHTPEIERKNIVLDTPVHNNGTSIANIADNSIQAYQALNAFYDYIKKLGPINQGNQIVEASTDLTVKKDSGTTSLPWINRGADPQNPNEKTNAAQDPLTTILTSYTHRDGVGGFTSLTSITAIDPDFYDTGTGTLVAVSNNQWTIQRFYFFGQNNATVITYGQEQYSSQSDAENAILTESPILSPLLNAGTWVTALVVKEGTTNLSLPAQRKFIPITSQSSSPVSPLKEEVFSFYVEGTTLNQTTTVTTSGASVVIAEMTHTFTPESATNKIRARFGGSFQGSADIGVRVAIFVDGVEIESSLRKQYVGNATAFHASVYSFAEFTNATVPITVTAQMWVTAGTLTSLNDERNFLVAEKRA